jgi:hypothetical protein
MSSERIIQRLLQLEAELRDLKEDLGSLPLRLAQDIGGSSIIQGTLDGKLQQNGTAQLSVYHNDVDTLKNVTLTAEDFVGYISLGTWCHCYFDGKYWRPLSPLGHSGLGEAQGAVSQDASGTMDVYYDDGTWTDTLDDLSYEALVGIGAGDRLAWNFDTRGLIFVAGCLA